MELHILPIPNKYIPKRAQSIILHLGVEISISDSSISILEKFYGGCPL